MSEFFGTLGPDELEPSEGSFAFGGGSSDTITGAANSRIYGGSGADVIFVSTGNTVFAGAGNDTIRNIDGENNRIFAGDGNDDINGDAGDILVGGAGDDIFRYFSGDSDTTILDFNQNEANEADKMFIALAGIGFDDLTLDTDTSAGDTLVTLPNGTVLATVKGVTDLTENDFIFLIEDNAGSTFAGAFDLGTLSAPDTLTQLGSFSEEDEADMYKVTFDSNSVVDISLSGLSSENYADLFLIRDNGDGVFDPLTDTFVGVSQNDDGSDQLINAEVFGEYYILISQVDGATIYDLTLTTTIDLIEDNAGSTFAGAFDLGTLTNTISKPGSFGSVNSEGEVDESDMYKFNVASDESVDITLSGLNAENYAELFLIQDDGDGIFDPLTDTFVGVSQNRDGSDQIIDVDLLAGEYFILIGNIKGAINYDLDLAIDVDLIEDGAGSTFAGAVDLGTLTSEISQAGSFGSVNSEGEVDESDMYKFNVASDESVDITLSGLNAENYAELFLIQDDGDGIFDPLTDTFVGSSQNRDGSDQVIDVDLLAGEYFILLSNIKGAINYDLELAIPLIEDGAGSTFAGAFDLGTISTPDTITKAGSFSEEDEADMYKVTFESDSVVDISLSGLNSTNYANLFLIQDDGDGVFDANTDTIIGASQNDDGSPQSISEDVFAGEYFILIEQVEGAINYDLSLTTTEIILIEDNAGSTFGGAFDLGTISTPDTTTKLGSFTEEDNADMYKVAFDANSVVNITLTGLSPENYADLFLIQDDGDGIFDPLTDTFVGSSQNDDGSDQVINEILLDGGEFYILISQVAGQTNYDLTLTTTEVILF